jgi:hypothetical protein
MGLLISFMLATINLNTSLNDQFLVLKFVLYLYVRVLLGNKLTLI